MTCNEVRQLVIDAPIHTLPYDVRLRWHEHTCACAQCRRWLVAIASRAVREGRTGRAPGVSAERVARLDRASTSPEQQAHLQELLRQSGGFGEIPEEVLREVER
jgi:hypothetical protein